MKKILDIDIPYYEHGKELKKTVKIGFVSNRVLREYNVLAKKLSSALELHGEMQKKTLEIAEIVVNKKIGFIEKRKLCKPINEEITEIKTQIKEADESGILNDRFEIIKRLLDDNEINDTDLKTYKWWDNNTEVTTSWGFLAKAVMKDVPEQDGKKKSNMSLTNLY